MDDATRGPKTYAAAPLLAPPLFITPAGLGIEEPFTAPLPLALMLDKTLNGRVGGMGLKPPAGLGGGGGTPGWLDLGSSLRTAGGIELSAMTLLLFTLLSLPWFVACPSTSVVPQPDSTERRGLLRVMCALGCTLCVWLMY